MQAGGVASFLLLLIKNDFRPGPESKMMSLINIHDLPGGQGRV
jgi:hypothetical protein